ncbi:MAG: sugar phosphate nucleotidyltransferase [Nitrososphaerales archaeon]
MGNLSCVIMAGGEGSRLRPLTANRPKPMIPIVNTPILEYTVKLLKGFNFKNLIFTLHYLPRFVMDYFDDGSKWGVKINHSLEDKPLGTAGGVKAVCEAHSLDRMLVWSGDVLASADVNELIKDHQKSGSAVTMVVTKVEDPSEFGVVVYDDNYRVVKFQEKPSKYEALSNTINCGIYLLEKEALDLIPSNREFDFSKDLFPLLLKKDIPISVWLLKGFWSDIGTHAQYHKTNMDLLNNRVLEFQPEGKRILEGVVVRDDVDIRENVELIPPVYIGHRTRIGRNSKLGPNTIIGDGCTIESDVKITNSILWNNTWVGNSVNIEEAIIGEKCLIWDGTQILNGAIVGDECKIRKYSTIKPNVKIWPGKIIEPYSIVSSNLKYGIKWPNYLFLYNGIVGQVNLEITPEMATKIGGAIGSWLGYNKIVAIGRDNTLQSRIVKRAIISGLLASGVKVEDLKDLPLPAQISHLLNRSLNAGIYVSSNINQPEQVAIRVFDYDGFDIDSKDQRKIESIFFREELHRAPLEYMGSLIYPESNLEFYLRELFKRFSYLRGLKDIRMVIDVNEGSAYSILPSLIDFFEMDAIVLNSRSQRSPLRPPWSLDNLIKMPKILNSIDADCGIILDENCERIAIVTKDGKVYSGEKILALISYHLLRRNKKRIVTATSVSKWIVEALQELGAEVFKVSRNLGDIARRTISMDALLGGDEMGRIFIPSKAHTFDGIATMLTALEAIREETHKEVYELIKLNKLVSRVSVPQNLRAEILSHLVREAKGHTFELLDGVKIEEEIGSLSIVLDPKEPLIELNAEAKSEDQAEKLLRNYTQSIMEMVKKLSEG